MRKIIVSAITIFVFIFTAQAQAKGLGGFCGKTGMSGRGYHRTYPSYVQPRFKSLSPAPQRNYKNGGQIYMQAGYSRNNGTYVMPHFKTKPGNFRWNNLGRKRW